MKRTAPIAKPDLILTADLHFRDDTPQCRTDDYWAAQERKLDSIINHQTQENPKVIVAGDFFNRAKSSPYLEAWLIDKLWAAADMWSKWIIVPGQHDMPNHRQDLLPKSSLAVLDSAEVIDMCISDLHEDIYSIHSFPFGKAPKPLKNDLSPSKRHICVAHHLVAADFPGHESEKAREFLRRMKGYDLVLTGDNHRQFAVEVDGRWLVNPGSMMRMKSDQMDHEPAVYLWYAETNRVERVPLPIEQGVISRAHIEKQEQRDERIDTYVNRLGEEYDLSLEYEENLKKRFAHQRVRRAVRDRVWEAVEGGPG